LFGEITIAYVGSDLEDFPEGHYIGREGKGSDPMPFRSRPELRLHSIGAEKHRL